jgi:hypothetical protein
MDESEKRAATAIAYASLVVRVDGRDALPVRAIPYVTGWTLSPDVVAKNFARQEASSFAKLQNTNTYHIRNGRVFTRLPKEWDMHVAALQGFEAELREQFADDDRGYAAWVSQSVCKLPPSVFVWLDEFTAIFERDYSPERLHLMDERQGDRDLNLSPYLDNDSLTMVLEGFETRAPLLDYESTDIYATLAEQVYNGRPIEWGYWVKKMPTLSGAEAARLMAGLDPELFEDLAARPVAKNDPSRACAEAKRIERLAQAQGSGRRSPEEWLRWAREHDLSVHRGFFMAVWGRHLCENEAQILADMPRAEAAVWERAPKVGEGTRQVAVDFAKHVTTATRSFPDFVAEVEERLARWRQGRYELIEAAQVLARSNGLDADQLATQMEGAIYAGKLTYRLNNIPVDAERIPRQSRLWHRVVLQKDVNAWLAASDAGYELAYPYDSDERGFVSLERRLESYFDLPLSQLPVQIAAVVRHEYELISWNGISPAQRRELARQRDMKTDPALAPIHQFYWNRTVREHELSREIETLKAMAATTVTEHARKKEMLCELETKLKQVCSEEWVDPSATVPTSDGGSDTGAGEKVSFKYAMHATRDQLIEAFGAFTGMNKNWFKNLKDTPALLKARKSAGQGGRGHIMEPFFCPFEVMQWLISGNRKKNARPLSEEKGWELLERYFPNVYAAYGSADPRE